MISNEFVFTGIVYAEGDRFSSLCAELDVASEGDTSEEATGNLLDAVTIYLESAVESNLPYVRPIPPDADPRRICPDAVVKVFPFKVDILIKAHV